MPETVKAYASKEEKAPLGPFEITRRDLRPDDVKIKITYCGICHSDLHQVNNDWGGSSYPMVPGHEIIGHVQAVGDKVTKYKKGDLVGVGCMVNTCRHCRECEKGDEQFCEKGQISTYNAKDIDGSETYGGYSQEIVVTEYFVLKVPDNLDPAGAAPLLCAGVTTYAPLKQYGAGPGKRVAVLGLGGLGHVALKIAHAMGAEVSLFSRSLNKAEDAKRLGAHRIVVSSDPKEMEAAQGYFDIVIDTIPYDHDINTYLNVLAPTGALCIVGYIGVLENRVITGPLVGQQKTISGSLIGGIPITQEALNFCGKHGITSDIELIKIQDINEAYARLLKGDVKYRFVIDNSSL